MGLALFAFAAIFLLVSSVGLLLFHRAEMIRRLSGAISPREDDAGWLSRLKIDRAGTSLKAAVRPFEKVLPKSAQEVSVTQKRLIRAGYREDSHVRIFFGAKVFVPLSLCLLAAVSGATYVGPIFAYALALGLGYLGPDFWVGRRIKKRQLNFRLGLPDFLDLMVVCIEAGLSLDQAL